MQTGHILKKARDRELSQHNISVRQITVVRAINDMGGKATPGKIAKWLLIEPHSVSGILKRMEEQGLVSKLRDPKNKGQITVSITKLGQRLYNNALKHDCIQEIMSCLSEEETEQLWSALHKLWHQGHYKLYSEQVDSVPLHKMWDHGP